MLWIYPRSRHCLLFLSNNLLPERNLLNLAMLKPLSTVRIERLSSDRESSEILFSSRQCLSFPSFFVEHFTFEKESSESSCVTAFIYVSLCTTYSRETIFWIKPCSRHYLRIETHYRHWSSSAHTTDYSLLFASHNLLLERNLSCNAHTIVYFSRRTIHSRQGIFWI